MKLRAFPSPKVLRPGEHTIPSNEEPGAQWTDICPPIPTDYSVLLKGNFLLDLTYYISNYRFTHIEKPE